MASTPGPTEHRPPIYGAHRADVGTEDLRPGSVVRVKRSRAKIPGRAPNGALLRERHNLMQPYGGMKLTVRSVRGLAEPPVIPGYWDLEHAAGRQIVEVTFDDGSVAYAPVEDCAWWTA